MLFSARASYRIGERRHQQTSKMASGKAESRVKGDTEKRTEKTRMETFLQEKKHLFSTLRQYNKTLDEKSLTMDKMMPHLQDLASSFKNRVLKVANQCGMGETLNTFLNEKAQEVAGAENSEANTLREDSYDYCYYCYSHWLELPCKAVEENRLDILKVCIKAWDNMAIFRASDGGTLLHVAVGVPKINFAIVQELLQCIPVNTNRRTALIDLLGSHTAEGEKLSLVKLFLEAGANLWPRNFMEPIPLNYYIEGYLDEHIIDKRDISVLKDSYWMQIIDILAAPGIDIEDEYGQTSLHSCFTVSLVGCPDEIVKAWFKVIDYLISKGANINTIDKNGVSILHSALGHLDRCVVNYALQCNCPLNVQSKLKLTPVYFICCSHPWSELNTDKCKEILLPLLEILVSAGVDLNIPAFNNSTVLQHTAATSIPEVSQFLVKSGADVNIRDFIGRTALHYAARNDPDIVKLLVDAGADINAQDQYGYSPLHYAVMYGNCSTVNTILTYGADPVVPCSVIGLQPLHLAGERGENDIIQALVAKGANVGSQDIYGATPLHYAAFDGTSDAVTALLQHGSKMDALDSMGNTPLSCALQMGKFKEAKLLATDPLNTVFPNNSQIPQELVEDYFEAVTRELKKMGKKLQ